MLDITRDKKYQVFLRILMILILFHALPSRAMAADRGIRTSFEDIIESFDDWYPGIITEDKELLVMSRIVRAQNYGSDPAYCMVDFRYRNIPSISVTVWLSLTGEVIRHSDFDLRGAIEIYKNAPVSYNEAKDIALDTALDILWSKEHADKRADFIRRFGVEPLQKDQLRTSVDFYLSDNVYIWDFWVTIKEFDEDRERYYENGINVRIDAATGRIVEIEQDYIYSYPYLLFVDERAE